MHLLTNFVCFLMLLVAITALNCKNGVIRTHDGLESNLNSTHCLSDERETCIRIEWLDDGTENKTGR